MPSLTTFKLLKQEHNARRGEFKTVHGTVQTPACLLYTSRCV